MAECITTIESNVAGRLASAAIQVCCLLGSFQDDLSDLKRNFELIQAKLHDAEKNQPENESDKKSLKFLKSASLEVENVLDEANTEAMIQKMHGEMGRKYMPRTFFTSYNPLMVRFKIALKLKNVREKLDKINTDISKFDLTASTSKDEAGRGGEILEMESPPEEIIGRDEEKKIIVDKICNHDDDDGVPRVYAIWGMGGVGKTTVAQLVYNEVKTHFDFQCRVYVSAVFDLNQIIKDICGSKDSELDEMSPGDLLRELRNKLEGKKYFIIMDDVWIEGNKAQDVKNWQYLCQALSSGAKGSTVMVTTRTDITARLMTKNIPDMQHQLAVLSREESWSLFKMLAFPSRGERENISSELEDVGRQIVEKCKGLPLAVKTLGITMLGKIKEVKEWELVRDDFMWEMQDKGVLPALRLSYNNLLPHWKRCFAYCCVFSKGERMSKDLLIELWMANEFIPSQGDLSLYEHGEKILSCLIQRSFFQVVVEEDGYTGKKWSRRMLYKTHDLMYELAQYEMGDYCAVIRPGKRWSDEVLHLSLSCEDVQFSPDLKNLRSVRSVLITPDKVPVMNNYTSNITQISGLVYLRVLYLSGIENSTLPESICKLIHLRYLKISESQIEVLPESIVYLQNLQTLILFSCPVFRELPKGLRYMRNLQRVEMKTCFFEDNLRHMPVGIKELTNLRRLSHFVVGKDDGAQIGELGNLNLLGRDLTLKKLENARGLSDAKSANLKDKTNLKRLVLDWTTHRSLRLRWSLRRSETLLDEEVLEGLEPNSSLQDLKIDGYMGMVLSPSWLVKLVNLTRLKFYRLGKCEHLPPLGKLPSLKRIDLHDNYSLKCFHKDDNATSKGETLFPSLRELHIKNCKSFVSLSSNFSKLRSLEIRDCELLSKRCKKDNGEEWAKISHIPHRDIQEASRWWEE